MSVGQLRLPGDDILHAAVAVRRIERHTHAGVLYRHANGQLFLLHLGGDCDLSHEVFDGSFAWVIPDLLPEEFDEVRAVCRAVWREMPRLHYSWILDVEATLDRETAQLVSERAPHGLTCSTFVLAVFRSAEVRLVDLEGWQTRPDDEVWYRRLLPVLQHRGVPQDRLQILKDNVGCLRVRPEEAAGACMAPARPARYEQCEPNGRRILAVIDARLDRSLDRPTHP